MIAKKYKLTKKEKINTCVALAILYFLLDLIFYFFYISGSNAHAEKVWSFFGINLVIVIVLGIYLYYADIDVLHNRRKLSALCAIMAISLTIYVLIEKWFSPYAVPYAFCALLCGLVISRKSGFLSSLVVVLMMFFAQTFFSEFFPTDYIPLFVGLSSTIVSSYMLSRQNKRIKYIWVAVELAILAVTSNILLMYAAGELATEIGNILLYSSLSGLISVALFMIAVPILDSVFKFVTDFSLAELTATDANLMKRMFKEAPGTFNHCLTVANYTEACASAIGENTYLARAAAYYHDIGKLKNPTYFSENQVGGHNPHDEITPELSTALIRKHVANGLQIAKENHLPNEILSFILEHHGTMPIQFFYSKAQKYTDGTLEDTGFRYDGPTPSTKIAAILMIADACEATLRALSVDNKLNAEKIVQNVIDVRLKYGQFNNCDITIKELTTIKNTIITVYIGISHERIVYPEQKKENESKI